MPSACVAHHEAALSGVPMGRFAAGVPQGCESSRRPQHIHALGDSAMLLLVLLWSDVYETAHHQELVFLQRSIKDIIQRAVEKYC
jgi:hypothetical protein